MGGLEVSSDNFVNNKNLYIFIRRGVYPSPYLSPQDQLRSVKVSQPPAQSDHPPSKNDQKFELKKITLGSFLDPQLGPMLGRFWTNFRPPRCLLVLELSWTLFYLRFVFSGSAFWYTIYNTFSLSDVLCCVLFSYIFGPQHRPKIDPKTAPKRASSWC